MQSTTQANSAFYPQWDQSAVTICGWGVNAGVSDSFHLWVKRVTVEWQVQCTV